MNEIKQLRDDDSGFVWYIYIYICIQIIIYQRKKRKKDKKGIMKVIFIIQK